MIPDELIEKALYAYDTTAGPPYSSTAGMRSALEAVAADIWDQGHHTYVERGPDDCTCNAWNDDECGCGEYGNGPIITPNPYRASEAA